MICICMCVCLLVCEFVVDQTLICLCNRFFMTFNYRSRNYSKGNIMMKDVSFPSLPNLPCDFLMYTASHTIQMLSLKSWPVAKRFGWHRFSPCESVCLVMAESAPTEALMEAVLKQNCARCLETFHIPRWMWSEQCCRKWGENREFTPPDSHSVLQVTCFWGHQKNSVV